MTLGDLAAKGKSIRLNFKVGYLSVSNSVMHWQHSREIMHRSKVSQSIDGNSQAASSTYDRSERGSMAFSVMTPSVAHYSRATSTDYRNHHQANPNPQSSGMRYVGPRDGLSSKGTFSPDKAAELTRFGKKIQFGNRTTNEELLQDHLKEMRMHLAAKKQQRDIQLE